MTRPIYVPALRLKQGEYRGLNRLAPDVADKVLPRLIVPPPKERVHGGYQHHLVQIQFVHRADRFIGPGQRVAT